MLHEIFIVHQLRGIFHYLEKKIQCGMKHNFRAEDFENVDNLSFLSNFLHYRQLFVLPIISRSIF